MFTGDVWYDVIAKGEEPLRIRVDKVRFSSSARTAWHFHAVGQTLYVTGGAGWCSPRGGEIIEIHPRRCHLYTPRRVALARSGPRPHMTYIAMWEAPAEGPESEWGALVTDAEYRGLEQ